jgi:hypothetical protein
MDLFVPWHTHRPRRLEGAPMKETEIWIERLRKVWEAKYALLVELQSAPHETRRAKE